ncbi:hypothetical protein CLAIMM_01751 [Cladophialophora immunda]|nr:hypothetical protein CLAIMM_01751 [Cladophialophora immunda]
MTAIYTGSYCPVGLTDRLTIPQLFTRYNPDNVPWDKVVHTDIITGKALTYGGLREQAASCAWGLRMRLGMKEGDRILVLIPNSNDYITLCHATLWMGGIWSPLNPAAATKDILDAIRLVKPAYICTEPNHLDRVSEALQKLNLPSIQQPTIFTVFGRVADLKLFPDDIAGTSKLESLPPYSTNGRSTKEVTAMIVYSSGTTGKIKGVQLSHYNLVSSLIQSKTSLQTLLASTHRCVFFPPYSHIFGLAVAVLGAMWNGQFVCALPSFDLEIYCQKMAEYKATWAHIVPPVAVQLADSDVPLKYDLSHLKIILVGAAPTKPALQARLKKRFGADTSIIQAYGMSECSPTVMHQLPSDDERNIGCVGKPVSATEVRVVDPITFEDVRVGDEGELWVRGPQTMMGYFDNEQATRETYVGEWLRTGDIMRMDENGNFWITDRLKEMIKYKGFQVAPSELEDVLLRHPLVKDAAVTSIYSDEEATELPIAYVTLPPAEHAMTRRVKQQILGEIRAWMDKQVTGYKKLRGGVLELNELPKTPSGKILRRELPCNKAKDERIVKL